MKRAIMISGWILGVSRQPLSSMQTKVIKLDRPEKEEIAYAYGPIFSNDN